MQWQREWQERMFKAKEAPNLQTRNQMQCPDLAWTLSWANQLPKTFLRHLWKFQCGLSDDIKVLSLNLLGIIIHGDYLWGENSIIRGDEDL